MNSSRWITALLVSALALLFSPVGQGSQERSAAARLDAMIEALGGRSALAELRTLAVEAACSGPGGRCSGPQQGTEENAWTPSSSSLR